MPLTASQSVPLAVIFGCSGPVLTPEERAFFKRVNPLGFILFSWNLQNKDQIRALIDSFHEVTGRAQLPILIDEEGGRVARLSLILGHSYPPAEYFEHLADCDVEEAYKACFDNYKSIGDMLKEAGITVNCVPVLDVRTKGASDIIGDRSFSENPELVGFLGEAAIRGTLAAGCQAVMKHIPGHGAALVDSHESLPIVDLSLEALKSHFRPFQMNADSVSWAMTAHILYSALDKVHPATQSSKVIQNIIRKEIGFNGFLVSDDLYMKALSGTPAEKTRRALAAGCDAVLYCKGGLAEFEDAARGARPLTPEACARLEKSHPFSSGV